MSSKPHAEQPLQVAHSFPRYVVGMIFARWMGPSPRRTARDPHEVIASLQELAEAASPPAAHRDALAARFGVGLAIAVHWRRRIVAKFANDYEVQHSQMAAASILATVPALLLMFFGQRFIVQGLAQGSVK